MEKPQSGRLTGQTMPARSTTPARPEAPIGPGATPGAARLDDIEKLDFETAYEELRRLVTQLESGDTTLEGALAAFEKATRLKARCTQLLDSAQARIETLTPEEPNHGTVDNKRATRESPVPGGDTNENITF